MQERDLRTERGRLALVIALAPPEVGPILAVARRKFATSGMDDEEAAGTCIELIFRALLLGDGATQAEAADLARTGRATLALRAGRTADALDALRRASTAEQQRAVFIGVVCAGAWNLKGLEGEAAVDAMDRGLFLETGDPRFAWRAIARAMSGRGPQWVPQWATTYLSSAAKSLGANGGRNRSKVAAQALGFTSGGRGARPASAAVAMQSLLRAVSVQLLVEQGIKQDSAIAETVCQFGVNRSTILRDLKRFRGPALRAAAGTFALHGWLTETLYCRRLLEPRPAALHHMLERLATFAAAGA